MTLPVSAPISMTQVMTELRVTNPGRAYPISLGDADVRALAGVPSGPISLTDLLGKRSYTPMTGDIPVADGAAVIAAVDYTTGVAVGVSVSNGIAPYSYAWSKLSGVGTVTASTASSTDVIFTVSRFASPGTILECTAQCVITDSTGATLTLSGVVTLTLD